MEFPILFIELSKFHCVLHDFDVIAKLFFLTLNTLNFICFRSDFVMDYLVDGLVDRFVYFQFIHSFIYLVFPPFFYYIQIIYFHIRNGYFYALAWVHLFWINISINSKSFVNLFAKSVYWWARWFRIMIITIEFVHIFLYVSAFPAAAITTTNFTTFPQWYFACRRI